MYAVFSIQTGSSGKWKALHSWVFPYVSEIQQYVIVLFQWFSICGQDPKGNYYEPRRWEKEWGNLGEIVVEGLRENSDLPLHSMQSISEIQLSAQQCYIFISIKHKIKCKLRVNWCDCSAFYVREGEIARKYFALGHQKNCRKFRYGSWNYSKWIPLQRVWKLLS